jgi:hypothetical protein
MLGDQRIWFTQFSGSAWAHQQIVPGVGTSTDLAETAEAPAELMSAAGKSV